MIQINLSVLEQMNKESDSSYLSVYSYRFSSFGYLNELVFGTRNGNRTHNYPLGGGYYIHLTMQAYSIDSIALPLFIIHKKNAKVNPFAALCAKESPFL